MNPTTATDDRQQLLDAFRHAGTELATIYLPSRSAVADAADRLAIRVGNVQSRLSELGASPELTQIVEDALADYDHAEGAGVILVAAPDGVVLRRVTFRPISRTVVEVGPTPHLLPTLAATQSDQPHLAVLVDRVGADAWSRVDLGEATDTTTLSGDELHVHRGHPGGWSQRRFQQRAENTWEANAKLVVEELLGDEADRPAVVAVGGDVRAVGFFRQHVPSEIELLEVDGSRAADADAFLDRVDTAVRTWAASRLVEALDELRDAVGTGTGVAGDEVLPLLTQGRVERLFVADDTADPDRPTARFDFTMPAVLDDGQAPKAAQVTEAPVTEGAVALAVATGAEVVVIPSGGVARLDGPVAGIARGSIET